MSVTALREPEQGKLKPHGLSTTHACPVGDDRTWPCFVFPASLPIHIGSYLLLWLLSQIATNLLASHYRKLLFHNSGGQKSGIKVSAGLGAIWGTACPMPLPELLVAARALGIPWFGDTSLQSLPLCLRGLLPHVLCVFSVLASSFPSFLSFDLGPTQIPDDLKSRSLTWFQLKHPSPHIRSHFQVPGRCLLRGATILPITWGFSPVSLESASHIFSAHSQVGFCHCEIQMWSQFSN